MGISPAVRVVALLLALGACATGPTPSRATPSRAAPREPADAGDGELPAPAPPAATAAPETAPAPAAPAMPPAPEPTTTTAAPTAHDVDELAPPTRTDGGPGFLILQNTGYVCAYDEARKNPAWVSYTFSGAIAFTGHQRESRFSTDTRTTALVKHDDYTNSGFDRGHMAPSFGIFSFFGDAAKKQTYLCSNIVPQMHALNDGPWGDVEDLEAKTWAPHVGKIRVFCGPAYTEPVAMIGRGVAVPAATWKIVVHATSEGRFEALAFLMPQNAGIHDAPSLYLVSVRAIEAAAHLDFFSNLPSPDQDALEISAASSVWK